MQEIIYKRANLDEELIQILKLQGANIPSSISKTEKKQEGFVTVHHDLGILKAMNDKCPHVIAKDNEKIIGYALCMLRGFKEDIDVLKPMFNRIDHCLPHDETYFVMGQICIDKAFRQQGVFKGLYHFMRQQLQLKYNRVITEVDVINTRSLNAHYAIGFETIYSYNSNNQYWEIISWDWS